MRGNSAKHCGLGLVLGTLVCTASSAQFLDDFSSGSVEEWTYFTGDGTATMEFQPGNGFATILVDSTGDKRNIWWALIKRNVSAAIDLARLKEPNQELRISARVRLHDAPKRVNLSLNTQKTTDFHTNLMEFDIPTNAEWHSISFTTHGFEAEPGDQVNGQLALMDWGRGRYQVDVDDFSVELVDVTTAGPDQGEQTPYRPPIPPLTSFAEHLDAAQAAVIDLQYPEMSFAGWADGETPVLAVGGSQRVILCWDLSEFTGRTVAGAGLLELTTHTLERSKPVQKDFGMIRVAEILGGDPQWDRRNVTLAGLAGDEPLDRVFNTQMIIDAAVAERRGDKTLLTISAPVLQRMLDGKTQGLVVAPLGAIHASFCATEHSGGTGGPLLHFTLQEP